jgi:HSP20 family protein
MEPTTLNRPQSNTADKKEYAVPLITTDELLFELQQLAEDEARPLVNIEDKDNAFVIEVAAPGLKNMDFNVSINECILTITCLHKESLSEKKLYRQHEFDYHCFTKDIVLPKNIDTCFISAEYCGCILRVIVPKSRKPFIPRTHLIVVY